MHWHPSPTCIFVTAYNFHIVTKLLTFVPFGHLLDQSRAFWNQDQPQKLLAFAVGCNSSRKLPPFSFHHYFHFTQEYHSHLSACCLIRYTHYDITMDIDRSLRAEAEDERREREVHVFSVAILRYCYIIISWTTAIENNTNKVSFLVVTVSRRTHMFRRSD